MRRAGPNLLQGQETSAKVVGNSPEICGSKASIYTSPTKKDDIEIYENHRCNKCNLTSLEPCILHQHKRDEHEELLESSSPPNKKRKEP